MRLPVSRLAYDTLERENARLRDALLDMTARYHTLRLMGAVPVPEPERPPPPSAPRDPVLEAIDEECGDDTLKRTMMLRQVRQDRAEGLDNDEIVRRIHGGTEPVGLPI